MKLCDAGGCRFVRTTSKNGMTSDLVVQADVKDGPGICRQ